MNKNTDINLVDLRDWYLDLSEVKQKRSLINIKKCLNNFIERIGNMLVSELKTMHVEKFRQKRLCEISERNVLFCHQQLIEMYLTFVQY